MFMSSLFNVGDFRVKNWEWGCLKKGGAFVKKGALIRMGALIGIGALIYKTLSKGDAYSEGGAYWKEGAKSNHYGMTPENLAKVDDYLSITSGLNNNIFDE